jgi:arsenate reductase
MQAKIYHNPRCSKSRATLAILTEHGIATDVVEYLRQPPTASDIRSILQKLRLHAAAIVRQGESAFLDSGLSADAPEEALIELILREPIVMERPIVIVGDRACLGRPPENVLELIT